MGAFNALKYGFYSTANWETFIKINPDFAWLLNEFTDKMKGYTIFELQESVGLQSKYAKNLYRILKQWRTKGGFVFKI